MSWFSFLGKEASNTELPDIFPLPILQKEFVAIDAETIFKRILTDVVYRTHGLSDEQKPLIWDNCLASNKQDGLITLLAKAMVNKSELFLVYIPGLKIIRTAEQNEQQKIRQDYAKSGESKVGVFITFKNYTISDMVRFYCALEYCAAGALWKQGNLSKAIQLKFTEMRSSTGMNDSSVIIAQAKELAKGMGQGRDIMLDAKDIVELAKVDMTATDALANFIEKKKSFYLGLPAAYMTGQQTGGMGDSGKTDTKAVERGLQPYFSSIIEPVFEGLFGKNVTYKSEDSDGMTTALEVLKTMDITSSEFLSTDNKTQIVNKAFGLDDNEKGDPQPEPTKPNDPANPAGGPVPQDPAKNSPPPKGG